MILAVYLLGVISGILLWEKVDFKTIYKGQIKIKQRGKGNIQSSDVTLKTDKKAKRDERKQANIIKRNERKAKRAAKRLDK